MTQIHQVTPTTYSGCGTNYCFDVTAYSTWQEDPFSSTARTYAARVEVKTTVLAPALAIGGNYFTLSFLGLGPLGLRG
jgi:hypothetical protein